MSRPPQFRSRSEQSRAVPGAHVVCRDPFKLERRREARETSGGTLCASYTNHDDRVGITYLDVLDRSSSGLRVRSRTQLDPGMSVHICPDGATVPWLHASAVRCEPDGPGFIIGLRLAPLAAAA